MAESLQGYMAGKSNNPPVKQRIPANPNATANKYNKGLLGLVTGLVKTVVANTGAISNRASSPSVSPQTAAATSGYVPVPGSPYTTSAPTTAGRPGRMRATVSGPSTTNVPSYVPKAYIPWVQKAAAGTGLPASVVAAQINDESGFDPNATSSANAQGIAQFEPGTFKSYGSGSPYNPNDALGAYTKYMSTLLSQYHGNVRDALAAYNAGPGNIQAGYGYADSILSAAGAPSTATTTGGTPSTSGGKTGYGATRPGGEPVTGSGSGSTQDTGQGVQQLLADYETGLSMPRVAPSNVGISGPLGPFKWWFSSFTNQWNETQGG